MKYIFHVRSFLPEFYTIIYPTTFSVDCSYLTGGGILLNYNTLYNMYLSKSFCKHTNN